MKVLAKRGKTLLYEGGIFHKGIDDTKEDLASFEILGWYESEQDFSGTNLTEAAEKALIESGRLRKVIDDPYSLAGEILDFEGYDEECHEFSKALSPILLKLWEKGLLRVDTNRGLIRPCEEPS